MNVTNGKRSTYNTLTSRIDFPASSVNSGQAGASSFAFGFLSPLYIRAEPIKPQTFTVTWVNAAGGDWATASNWSTGNLPGPADNVGISTTQQQTITHLSGSDIVNSLVVGNDSFIIENSSLTITSGATFGYQVQIDGGDLYLGVGNATMGALAVYGNGSPFVTDGDLDGSGTVTVTGNALLGYGSGAVMTGTGTTIIDGNTTISAGIGGQPIGTFFGLDGGRILQNAGTMTWTGGDIVLGFSAGGGIINNTLGGTFDIAGAASMSAGAGITGLVNAGLLEQTGTTGQSDIVTPLTNTGSVDVQLGTMSLDAGGISAANELTVASGATLAIGGGTFTIGTGGSLALAGALDINQGLLELGAENGQVSAYAQTGALDGTGTLAVTGTATLAGYSTSISGTGLLLLEGSTTVSGNIGLDAGRGFKNTGTLTWTGGNFELGVNYGGGTITNAAGATFNIEVNANIAANVGPTAFNNAGALDVLMTSGVTNLYTPFNNTGTVDIQTGELAFDGGGSSNAGAFTVASGAALAFIDNNGPSVFTLTGGTLNLAGSTVIGDGELDASAATITHFGSTLTLAAVSNAEGYSYPGYLELGTNSTQVANLVETNGTIDGTGTITITASTTFNGNAAIQTGTGTTILDGATTLAGNLALANDRKVQNAGTLTWTGGNVQLGYNPYATSVGGGTLSNDKGAIIDIENPVAMSVSGGNCAFTNAGLLEQTETTGETDLYAPFVNAGTGTVSVVSGTLSFDGGGTSAAGAFRVAAGATLGFNLDDNTTSTFTLTGGTYNVAGTTAIASGLLNVAAAKIASFGKLLYIGPYGALELGNQSTTVKSLAMSGSRFYGTGTLDGTGTLTVSGSADFGGFIMSGSGTTLLDGQSTLTPSLTTFALDGGRTLANAGTLALYGAWGIQFGVTVGGGTLDNLAGGVIDIETAGQLDGNLGATQFLNAGTLVQASTVSGITSVTTAFTNTGNVDIQAGFLSLDAGGSSNAASLTVAAGATLGFGAADRTAATFTLTGGALNIAGVLQLGSGTLELGTLNQTVSNYNQTGGDLDGTGTFTISGSTNLVSGTFLQSGLGTTVIAGTGVLNSADIFLDGGRTLENTGQLTLEGGGQIGLGINPFGSNIGGGTLINAAGATINIETNELINNETGATFLVNAGLLEQTLATGQTPFYVPVESTGTIDVQSGSVAFNDGESSFSGLIDGAGQISFNGNSVFNALTIGGTAALMNTGSITQTGPVALGDSTGAIASFTNAAGAIYTIAGSTLAKGKGATVFTNDGSLVSTGRASINPSFVDNGTASVTTGTLQIAGALTGSGTLSAGTGARADMTGGGSFAGTLAGAGTLAIAGHALTLTAGASLSADSVAESVSITLASDTVTNAAGNIYAINAASGATDVLASSGTGSSFTNAGTFSAGGAGTDTAKVAFINTGIVNANAGTLSFLGAVTDNGTIDAATGLTAVKTTVSGTGTLALGATGTLSLLLGAGSGQMVDFAASTGLLDLTKPLDFTGIITGFGGSDQIDLLNTAETSYSYTNNVLTVKNGTTTVASLQFTGTSNSFSLTSDGHSGTLIKFG